MIKIQSQNQISTRFLDLDPLTQIANLDVENDFMVHKCFKIVENSPNIADEVNADQTIEYKISTDYLDLQLIFDNNIHPFKKTKRYERVLTQNEVSSMSGDSYSTQGQEGKFTQTQYRRVNNPMK